MTASDFFVRLGDTTIQLISASDLGLIVQIDSATDKLFVHVKPDGSLRVVGRDEREWKP